MRIPKKTLSVIALFSAVAYAGISWSPTVFYNMGNMVEDNGTTYVAKAKNYNKKPAENPTYWTIRVPGTQNSALPGIQDPTSTSIPTPTTTSLPAPPVVNISAPIDNNAWNPSGINLNSGSSSQNAAASAAVLQPWSQEKTYQKGNLVTYANAIWRAENWNVNEVPGSTVSWTPTTETQWYPAVHYSTGQKVTYQGITYTAQFAATGVFPLGDTTGAWLAAAGTVVPTVPTPTPGAVPQPTAVIKQPEKQTVDAGASSADGTPATSASYPDWTDKMSYRIGAFVLYNGIAWKRVTSSDARTAPSTTADWFPIPVTNWYAPVQYPKGATVLNPKDANSFYMAQWGLQGVSPYEDTTGAWVLVDKSGAPIVQTASTSNSSSSGGTSSGGTATATAWDSTKSYAAGSKVSWEGADWLALNINSKEQPGTGGSWAPATLTKWYAAVTYDPNKPGALGRVTHLGVTWKVNYWSKGDEPSKNQAWSPIGTASWFPLVTYSMGDKVLFNGLTWVAKWGSVGQQPDTSDAWGLLP